MYPAYGFYNRHGIRSVKKDIQMKAIVYTKYGPLMCFSSGRSPNLFLKTIKCW
jgi:hypothetical protein